MIGTPTRGYAETVTWRNREPYEALCPVCRLAYRVRGLPRRLVPHGAAYHCPGGGALVRTVTP